MQFEIINRAAALQQGLKRFYTGKLCKHGHDSQRFVTTGGCVACNSARSRLFSQHAVAANGVKFEYPLHPGDIAAALSYCQALDMQRGRSPSAPASTEGIYEKRGERWVKLGSSPAPAALPAPDMTAIRAGAMERARQELGLKETPSYVPAP